MASALPELSAVVPTWNRAGPVVGAVQSVLAQAGVAVEAVVVDDGSTDGTFEALSRRYADEPRVRLLRQANGGTARARNAGIEAARAPYIGLLDSDDRWEPGFAAAHLEALGGAPSAALSLCDAAYVAPDGRRLKGYAERVHGRPPLSLPDLVVGGWALPSTMVFRAEVLRALRFDPAWGIEDTELLFRFFAAGHRAVWTPRVLARYAAGDPSEGAARKMASDVGAKTEQLRLMEAYAAHAPDPRAHAVRLARRRTLLLARAGRYGEAGPHARAWWRLDRLQLRAPWILLRSRFARR